MLDAHKNGLWSLVLEARRLSIIPEVRNNEQAIDKAFDDAQQSDLVKHLIDDEIASL